MHKTYTETILGTGQMNIPVAGTSFRQDILTQLCTDNSFYGVNQRCKARLISEPTNRHDAKAIRVEILGHCVGYLPRHVSENFGIWLRDNGYAAINAACQGMIVGGRGEVSTDEGIESESGNFGVRLDLAFPMGIVCEEDLNPNNEYVFAPMRQGRVVGNLLCTEDENLPLCPGEYVSFWLNKHDESLIVIYAKGSLGGFGRIGLLPDKYYGLVAPHLREGLPVDASIDRIVDGVCYIRFKLVPREVVAQQAQLLKEKRVALLQRPYKPRKPMQTTIVPENGECAPLKKGEALQFFRTPTFEECLSDDLGPTLVFCRTDKREGRYITAIGSDDPEFKRRVFRLGDLKSRVSIRVVGVNRTKHHLSYGVEITLPSTKVN